MFVARAHQAASSATLRLSHRLPVRKLRQNILLCSLFFFLLLGLLFWTPGHTSPVKAQSWSSSIVTVTNGSQAVAMPTTQQATPTAVQVTPTAAKLSASTALARIFQLDPAQYDSASDENTWGMSACSTAALTEVLNAYGFAYRIADVLHVQAQLGAITVASGLTTEAGIEQTAAHFGFQTSWGHNLSLDQVIATANGGRPVIVSFPPQVSDLWPTGHVLVVRGGNATTIFIADSSRFNSASLSRQQFNSYWRGFSAVLTPPNGDVLAGHPTISVSLINQVLAHYGSPAQGLGQSLYNLGKQFDIDPVYGLAFFMHESSFGTAGLARITHSLGNSRCVAGLACVNTSGGNCQQGQSCYASYASWQDGFRGWYQQIIYYENGALERQLTGQWRPLTSLQVIIPVFAPATDNNDEAAYIAAIQTAVATWRAGKVVVPLKIINHH